ncbi:type III secretion system needle complex protein [Burkholderia ubonensis]|uniref:type III secretion system needle complex protein n=1 Tax=Burkholderia ubonensis TaxID=101571 RepID=UPI000754EF90|nr:type III secretion system needle complex protein [Burkholderia ubonensis]KVD63242.1 type III secretion system protein PrgI [Burkholderia ubonensis]KVP01151.1 type III secretion system protein PrgI [Burkholderia ubonensis]KVP48684.1 type III secretion system protein PrgI [Burkholderia ubonensis]KVR42590.1 type III secretion system protein PrgI [Burkholderia ubonensis]KVU30876.1 type III secretion system protein PrgI [Burkholderia ubonensis]
MTWEKGYLDGISKEYDKGVVDLQEQVDNALKDLATSPSDPQKLARYQSKLSEYNLYRNAQSNTVKVFKDIDAAIIQNFR